MMMSQKEHLFLLKTRLIMKKEKDRMEKEVIACLCSPASA